jgi:threonine dehydrogenase-like Zn-dependent dehydrogenase
MSRRPDPIDGPAARDSMKAAVLKETGQGVATVVIDWPVPVLGPRDVLIRVSRSGICGSDVHFALDRSASTAYTPIVLGHEAMGYVIARGEAVDTVVTGDRVSILPIVTCGQCRYCSRARTALCNDRACIGVDRDGALAELIAVPERNCIAVPDAVSDEMAAVVTDAVATAYHAVAGRGEVGPDSEVAVWGVGGLGLSAVAIAMTLGAARVIAIDLRESARAAALQMGADAALAPTQAVQEFRAGAGADVAFEFVGSRATAELAVRSARRGGRAVLVGVAL